MSDVTVHVQSTNLSWRDMQNTTILDVAPGSNLDMAKIAAQACARTDVATGTNMHIPNQYGPLMDKRRLINSRALSR